jgi:hypothetical protein
VRSPAGRRRSTVVDALEDLVAEHDTGAREQVVELFRGARTEDGGCHARVRDHDGDRQMGQNRMIVMLIDGMRPGASGKFDASAGDQETRRT